MALAAINAYGISTIWFKNGNHYHCYLRGLKPSSWIQVSSILWKCAWTTGAWSSWDRSKWTSFSEYSDFTISYKLGSETAQWVPYFKVPGSRENFGNPPAATTHRSNSVSDALGTKGVSHGINQGDPECHEAPSPGPAAVFHKKRALSQVLCFTIRSDGKESACNVGGLGSVFRWGRSPGEGKSSPLQYSCLKNSMDIGTWRVTVHGVARVRHDWENNTHTHTHHTRYTESHLTSLLKRKSC